MFINVTLTLSPSTAIYTDNNNIANANLTTPPGSSLYHANVNSIANVSLLVSTHVHLHVLVVMGR